MTNYHPLGPMSGMPRGIKKMGAAVKLALLWDSLFQEEKAQESG